MTAIFQEIQIGGVGVIIDLTLRDASGIVDLSGATVKQIIFGLPDGTALTKAASFKTDGIDGVLRYVTVAGDLEVAGQWRVQAYVKIGASEWYSGDDNFFKVNANLVPLP